MRANPEGLNGAHRSDVNTKVVGPGLLVSLEAPQLPQAFTDDGMGAQGALFEVASLHIRGFPIPTQGF